MLNGSTGTMVLNAFVQTFVSDGGHKKRLLTEAPLCPSVFLLLQPGGTGTGENHEMHTGHPIHESLQYFKNNNLLLTDRECRTGNYYPTLLRRVQISRETSTNITRYYTL